MVMREWSSSRDSNLHLIHPRRKTQVILHFIIILHYFTVTIGLNNGIQMDSLTLLVGTPSTCGYVTASATKQVYTVGT